MNLMVDIESLGTMPNAVITQIGACYFDWDGSTGETFLCNIRVQDCLDKGCEVDAGSLKFWFKQIAQNGSPDWLCEPKPFATAMQTFCQFRINADTIWSHTFDQILLQHAGLTCGIKTAMPYRKLRDIRTLIELSGLKITKDEIETRKSHNALEDCLYQIEYCVMAHKKLKKESQDDSENSDA